MLNVKEHTQIYLVFHLENETISFIPKFAYF